MKLVDNSGGEACLAQLCDPYSAFSCLLRCSEESWCPQSPSRNNPPIGLVAMELENLSHWESHRNVDLSAVHAITAGILIVAVASLALKTSADECNGDDTNRPGTSN